ncbi:proteasome maturation protein [Microplitis mediator]|uniref:proteasome maturation protein n=1 Tax=Microplitis mediator TaxID=375433 RepID=UPI002554C639|nr:proteasome maturation protein [Microplitis mediator]
MSFNLASRESNGPAAESFDMPTGSYGAPDPMIHGLANPRQNLGFNHPLEASERNFHQTRLQREMNLMRNVQGIHAPIRLAMELKAADQVGRHPFLPSSNIMRDVLLGRDEEIGFEDVLNPSEFREQMLQPHAVVEKKLRLL